jgi:hypothetical protein
MFIGIIIIGVFVGLFLAFVLAPIVMVMNKKKLKEMDAKIEVFETNSYPTNEAREKAKQTLKKELIGIKAKIVADKKSTAEAADKISII